MLGWVIYGFSGGLKIPRSTVTKTVTKTVSTTETTTMTHTYTKTLTKTITEASSMTTSSQQATTTETSENPTTIPLTVPSEFEPFVRIFPRAAAFNPVLDGDKILYYEVYDARNVLIGYAFVIKVLTCPDMLKVYGVVDLNYNVVGIDVMPSEEVSYPTWWSRQVSDVEFEEQFHGLSVEELHIDRDGGKVHAVSGATLSSRSVTEAIGKKILAIVSGEGHQDVYKIYQVCPVPIG